MRDALWREVRALLAELVAQGAVGSPAVRVRLRREASAGRGTRGRKPRRARAASSERKAAALSPKDWRRLQGLIQRATVAREREEAAPPNSLRFESARRAAAFALYDRDAEVFSNCSVLEKPPSPTADNDAESRESQIAAAVERLSRGVELAAAQAEESESRWSELTPPERGSSYSFK